MTRTRLTSILPFAAAGLLALTAVFHYSGLGYVRRLASEAGGDLTVIAPLLWVSFSVDLVALALVAAIIGSRPDSVHWLVPLCLALPPAAAAALQVQYVGFGLPTAVLILDAALLVATGAALRWRGRSPG